MAGRFYLGKGLREPVSPYRELYVFGHEFGPMSADNWNSLPAIVEETSTFDLSPIEPFHEVCVVTANITNPSVGDITFNFKWYKDNPRTLIFEFEWSYDCGDIAWVYAYSYIGYCDWEINENGAYHVDISVSGAANYAQTINFTVTGIAPEPEPPPSPPSSINTIIDAFGEVSITCYAIYVETLSWVWPFWLVAEFFYTLSLMFNNLAWSFYYFNEWVINVTDRIAQIVTLADIQLWFNAWTDKITAAYEWVINAATNIQGAINSWWLAVSGEVQDWINAAVGAYEDIREEWSDFWYNLWPGLVESFNDLRSSWTDFWSNLYPNLVNFSWLTSWWNDRISDVSTLIDNAFRIRTALWDGWMDVRANVLEFLEDPLEWLWDKFTDWFIGPEE